jgi:hypothetical protein
MCARRAVYLWTGYWSFDRRYLALESTDMENIPVATFLSLLGFIGVFLAFRRKPVEAIRYGGVLFLFPIMYYFTHPVTYHMRPLDPLLAILGGYAVVTLLEKTAERARPAIVPMAVIAEGETPGD